MLIKLHFFPTPGQKSSDLNYVDDLDFCYLEKEESGIVLKNGWAVQLNHQAACISSTNG
jgi:hypothetical protein